MPRTQIESQYLGQFTLSASTPVRQTFDFPLGELYYALDLRIAITATVGASPVGATAFTEPFMELVNLIRLESDRDGVLANLHGKALWLINQVLYGTQPARGNAAFAANTAAAYAGTMHLRIPLADPRMIRPEDTALATDRYSSLNLTVGIGAGADMLSTAHSSGGGITLSAMTCDVEVVKLQGPIPDGARPVAVQRLQQESGADNTNTTTTHAFIRSPKRAVKRVYAYSANLGTTSRGFAGNGNDSILSTLEMSSDLGIHQRSRRVGQIQDENKVRYSMETWPAGLHVMSFVQDGSTLSALATGDKSRLQVDLVQAASPPAGTNTITYVSQAVEQLAE